MLHSETACIQALDRVEEDDFADPFSRNTFLLIKSLYQRSIRPTYVEIIKEGHHLGFLQNSADMEQLRYITEHYIDEENIHYWIGEVKNASKGKAMQKLLIKYSRELKSEQPDITSIIREASGELFSLVMDTEEMKTLSGKDLAEYGKKLIKERVDAYRKAKDDEKFPGKLPLEGVPTGLPTLDDLSLGYKPGDLIILAAQTGHGKTAFAINTSNAVCVVANKPLYYLNTEMSNKQLVYRWGSVLSGEITQMLRNGSLSNEQLNKVLASFDALAEAGFYTDAVSNLTPYKADIQIRKQRMQHQIEMVIIDYVGRMQKIQKGLDEWQVLEQIVKSMKELAQNQEIAIMILAQLNDDGTLQGAKRMKNECDMMFRLVPIVDREKISAEEQKNAIRKQNNKNYEDFNYRLYTDKARDFETGKSIPIIFDMERQQICEAKETGKPLVPKQEDHWGDIGKYKKGV